jgi:hypothetical protein
MGHEFPVGGAVLVSFVKMDSQAGLQGRVADGGLRSGCRVMRLRIVVSSSLEGTTSVGARWSISFAAGARSRLRSRFIELGAEVGR